MKSLLKNAVVKSPGFEFCEVNQCLFCLVKDSKNLQFRVSKPWILLGPDISLAW